MCQDHKPNYYNQAIAEKACDNIINALGCTTQDSAERFARFMTYAQSRTGRWTGKESNIEELPAGTYNVQVSNLDAENGYIKSTFTLLNQPKPRRLWMTSKSELKDQVIAGLKDLALANKSFWNMRQELNSMESQLNTAKARIKQLMHEKLQDLIAAQGQYFVKPVTNKEQTVEFHIFERYITDENNFGDKRVAIELSREDAEATILELAKGITYYDTEGDEVEPAE